LQSQEESWSFASCAYFLSIDHQELVLLSKSRVVGSLLLLPPASPFYIILKHDSQQKKPYITSKPSGHTSMRIPADLGVGLFWFFISEDMGHSGGIIGEGIDRWKLIQS